VYDYKQLPELLQSITTLRRGGMVGTPQQPLVLLVRLRGCCMTL
jgi:hypothetical protein